MLSENSIEAIARGVKEGNKLYAAQLMSMIENEDPKTEQCLQELYPLSGKSYVLGVTGWAGVGKSTLINRLARAFLTRNESIGIIAMDPSSPFSGGSLLGDRERMRDVDGDERLFIRSVATRGATGGISSVTRDFIKVMKAMGKEIIILETVGVGQDQVALMQVADTIVMTMMPGMGDYLQSLKAGVLEICDIFIVNKADRQGGEHTVADLKMLINLNGYLNDWKPPILETVAINGTGIEELIEMINKHRMYLKEASLLTAKKMSMTKSEIVEIIKSRLIRYIMERVDMDEKLENFAQQVSEGTSNPYACADAIIYECGIIK